MAFKVRPCRDLEEFGQAVFAIGQYFGLEPTEERMERFAKNLPIERMHACREDGVTVGGAGAFPFELTVPGAVVPTAGITVVGTFPTHRRRGVLRSMMRAQLDDVHARGEPLALLWASEDTIYGRFGYGMASQCTRGLDPEATLGFCAAVRARGDREARGLRRSAQALPPRLGRRPAKDAGHARPYSQLVGIPHPLRGPGGGGEGAGPKRLVVLEREGRPEGYAIYRHKPKWTDGISDSELQVVEAVALDGRPTAEIWRYLLDIDWSARTTASLLPVDHPLWWLLATPRNMRPRVGDGLWVRLVDVGAALSARAYASDGAVVFDVIDDFCPWNAGLWRVSGGRAKRTTAAPQLRLDVNALGSRVPRGLHVLRARARRPGRGAASRRRRASGRAVRGRRAPWCPEIF